MRAGRVGGKVAVILTRFFEQRPEVQLGLAAPRADRENYVEPQPPPSAATNLS